LPPQFQAAFPPPLSPARSALPPKFCFLGVPSFWIGDVRLPSAIFFWHSNALSSPLSPTPFSYQVLSDNISFFTRHQMVSLQVPQSPLIEDSHDERSRPLRRCLGFFPFLFFRHPSLLYGCRFLFCLFSRPLPYLLRWSLKKAEPPFQSLAVEPSKCPQPVVFNRLFCCWLFDFRPPNFFPPPYGFPNRLVLVSILLILDFQPGVSLGLLLDPPNHEIGLPAPEIPPQMRDFQDLFLFFPRLSRVFNTPPYPPLLSVPPGHGVF